MKFYYGIKVFCKDILFLISLYVNKMKNILFLEISSKVLNVVKEIWILFFEYDSINMFVV